VKLLLFLAASSTAVAFAVWTYGKRELPIAGRWRLAAVRSATLVLALLLLFDPRLPWDRSSGLSRWVLVDGSVSMGVGPIGAAPWDSAAARARALRAEGASVLSFGGEPYLALADSVLGAPPSEPSSLLVPALERAVEAGAHEVVVLSDLRLEDPVGVRAALQRLGLAARFEVWGAETRNAGIAVLTLPADVDAGEGVMGEVSVFATGVGDADSLRVEVREEELLVWSSLVPAPTVGRVVRVPLKLTPPVLVSGGEVRYRAIVSLAGDLFAADDETVAYTVVDPREGTLVGVSFAPDWELRHLMPVLARATGLPTRGFIQAGDFFVTAESGGERSGAVSADSVAARAMDADIVVLHGLGAGAPDWARQVAAQAPRALVFVSDPAGALAAGVRVASSQPGEWYLDTEPPPSPLLADLAALRFQGLPPLTEVFRPVGGLDGVTPLEVRLRGTGRAESPLVLRERGGGRAAVVLATGWWRWALRPGPAKEAYGRVWSSVAGWLTAGGSLPSQRVRPTSHVVPPGEAVEWTSSGVVPLRLTVFAVPGDSGVTDTTLAQPVEALRTPELVTGSYRYQAVSGSDSTAGRFDVHATSAELRHPRMEVPDSIPPPPGRRDGGGAGRPLRAYPLPYFLLLGLLCSEWVVRRRKGLR
jgi:hypothetical protein